jgi:YHS domain-containing protein
MIIERRRAIVLLSGAVLAGGGVIAYRGLTSGPSKPVNTLDSPSGAAIKGYDPVAYFVAGKPMRGTSDHSVNHNGVTWLFANAGNKAMFEKEPAKFTPAFGGYCAYGVAQGYLVKIEPDAWSIRNGTLYLNYDAGVQKEWEKNATRYISTAEIKWPRLAGLN